MLQSIVGRLLLGKLARFTLLVVESCLALSALVKLVVPISHQGSSLLLQARSTLECCQIVQLYQDRLQVGK